MSFDTILLQGIRELAPNAYGVPLRQHAERALGRMVSIGELYATLERLGQDGLVRSWQGEATPERGWRLKRFWELQKASAAADGG